MGKAEIGAVSGGHAFIVRERGGCRSGGVCSHTTGALRDLMAAHAPLFREATDIRGYSIRRFRRVGLQSGA